MSMRVSISERMIHVLNFLIGEKGRRCVVDKEPIAIRYMAKPSVEIQRIVIEKNPLFIEYIANPTPEIQADAVNADSRAAARIKNPTDEVLMLAKLSE